jgi:methylated-DNA-protein-cysteine methyltransferase-like protein
VFFRPLVYCEAPGSSTDETDLASLDQDFVEARGAPRVRRWIASRRMTLDFEDSVVRVVAGLQPGEVATYGEVAAEAGHPGAARAVGTVLARNDAGLPWWRVVTGNGRLVPGHEVEHAGLLRSEGVPVVDGRVRPGGRAGRADPKLADPELEATTEDRGGQGGTGPGTPGQGPSGQGSTTQARTPQGRISRRRTGIGRTGR